MTAATAKKRPEYALVCVEGYDLASDTLSACVDSSQHQRCYSVAWRAESRALTVWAHWDWGGDETQSRDLPAAEQLELWRWLDSSDDIADLVSEMRTMASEMEDPRP